MSGEKKNFSAEIIEIFWDTMSHSKFFMAEIEDKQSLKMSISAAFQTTFNRFPCPHAHPALTSTAAKLLLVAKDRLSRNSFEISQTLYYSRAPTPTPIDPKHAKCPLFPSLNIENDFLGKRSFATYNNFAAVDFKAGCA